MSPRSFRATAQQVVLSRIALRRNLGRMVISIHPPKVHSPPPHCGQFCNGGVGIATSWAILEAECIRPVGRVSPTPPTRPPYMLAARSLATPQTDPLLPLNRVYLHTFRAKLVFDQSHDIPVAGRMKNKASRNFHLTEPAPSLIKDTSFAGASALTETLLVSHC